MFVQVVVNKSLTYYGALSPYGADIPLACTGIVMKVNQVYFSICIGVAQGIQPIASFNRGAGKNDRVKKTYKLAVSCNTIISTIAFIIFQLFPRDNKHIRFQEALNILGFPLTFSEYFYL